MTVVTNRGKKWTDYEIDYVSERITKYSIEKIAAKLGRTPLAVRRMLDRVEGSRRIAVIDGMYNIKEFSDIIGVDERVIYRWIKDFNFPIIKNSTSGKNNGCAIDPNKVWKWVEKNRHRLHFNPSKVKVDLIPEQKWLLDDIKRGVLYGSRMRWTKENKAKLLNMRYNEKKMIKECAEYFGCSESSANKQLIKLRELKFNELNTILQTYHYEKINWGNL